MRSAESRTIWSRYSCLPSSCRPTPRDRCVRKPLKLSPLDMVRARFRSSHYGGVDQGFRSGESCTCTDLTMYSANEGREEDREVGEGKLHDMRRLPQCEVSYRGKGEGNGGASDILCARSSSTDFLCSSRTLAYSFLASS